MYHRFVCYTPAVSPSQALCGGESITPYDAIQIVQGASWTWGLYSDMANRSFYVCDRGIVVAVFTWQQMKEATQQYGRCTEEGVNQCTSTSAYLQQKDWLGRNCNGESIG
jgi:hypothetical protein